MPKPPFTKPPPDLSLALESLLMCRRPDGTFLVDQYLCACNQLLGFMGQLSKPIKIILRQMRSGIKALEIRRVAGPRNYYETFQTVIEYELKTGLARTKSPMSGCKALLLVHEHFKFITMFMRSLLGQEGREDENQNVTQSSLMDIYRRTLASCHSKPMRAVSKMCVRAVPASRHLLSKVKARDGDVSESLEEVLVAAEPICDRLHKLCYDTNLEQILSHS